MMNVAFYCATFEKNVSGINRYTRGILDGIKNQEIKKYCFGQNSLHAEDMVELHTVHKMNQAYGDGYAEKERYLLCRLAGIDVLYSFFSPICLDGDTGINSVLTIYDLTPLINMEWHMNNKQLYDMFDIEIRKSAQNVNKIVTISEASKKSIVDIYGIPEDKIEIVTPAIAEDLIITERTEEEMQDVRRKYAIRDSYILSICTFEPRKNMISLIKAYEMYRDKNKTASVQLVLTGKLGWGYGNLLDMIYDSKYKEDIIMTGYVSDYDLGSLYRGAMVFAYVSYFEGFGMPVLEALNYGKAVLTSDTTSMPEVGGDAVCYCNPYELESVYSSLEQLLEDAEYREKLQEKAKTQTEKFSYEKSAKKVEELLFRLDRR